MTISWRRVRLRFGAACIAAGVAVSAMPGTFGSAAAVADSAGGGATTASGGGPFSSLKVTISQTTNLIDQVVQINWTGGAPTLPFGGADADYLQIMQCWGDDPAGPDRTQCEFGALVGSAPLNGLQSSREVYAGPATVDPLETLLPTPDNPDANVPFAPVHPNTDPGADNSPGQYFGTQTTNEIPFARTQPDGTGEVFFETQTTREAPGLGCGEQVSDTSGNVSGRPCWLVIVPRGETEVNGAPYSDHGGGLQTSPLSESNWKNRIVVPLQFEPVGLLCPLGGREQRTLGQEMAEEAVSRWQPSLCTQTGTAYGYTPVSDDTARARLTTSNPGLNFVGQPLAPASVPPGAEIAYAPVAISGDVIAFNMDTVTFSSSPPALQARNGLRVPDLNLTQRLVAKLITQSYQQGAATFDPAVAQNPASITADPDFIAVNPGLTGLFSRIGDVLMPFTSSDAVAELWTWINADPEAKAFLDGAPDPWGMTVNPAYKGITDAGVPNDFPKSDAYCQTTGFGGQVQPPICTLDIRPYANDMHDAARSAARGDTLARTSWDATQTPPSYKKVPAQSIGSRGVMAFTDAATAARYSLPVARLRNAAGQFVAPDAAGLAAGVAAMTQSGVPGVLSANPAATSPAAYPLTAITYAATVPAVLTQDSRTAFASFLKYAATSGQQPGLNVGELPFGYLPLTDAMSWQTLQLATSLFGPRPTATATPSPTPVKTTAPPKPKPTSPKPKPTIPKPTGASPSEISTTAQPPVVVQTTTAQPLPPVVPVVSPAATPEQVTPPPDTPAPTATSRAAAVPSPEASSPEPVVTFAAVPTAGVQVGASRYLALMLLAVGALCAFSGPLLLRFASRRSR
jgi:hypothetical protein